MILARVKLEVAVLDLSLSDCIRADLTTERRRASPGVGMLILSACLDSENLEKSTEAGVDEILDKLAAPDEILGAIRRTTARA
jgi:DNA-binding NarL/FixJ family response regulator